MSGQDVLPNTLPTRMTLQRLQVRLGAAQKGHRLLKKKADALTVRFRQITKDIYDTKMEMGNVLKRTALAMAETRYAAGDISQVIQQKVSQPSALVRGGIDNIAGVHLPVFNLECSGSTSMQLTGLSAGGSKIEKCAQTHRSALDTIVKLASLQTSFLKLDEVIKLTNRRVNAIENVVIPKIKNTIQMIKDHLDEEEREEFTRMKKIVEKKKKRIEMEKAALEARREMRRLEDDIDTLALMTGGPLEEPADLIGGDDDIVF
ncbi:ATPase, V1 complex, subunit D [Carpediemonas membranifera]|uniref:ATPase, V1 complex, subunit D n=1 Tax=Carpediemonas membranifera TaxID=201153 RepID=A0A8J6E0Q2_9EUKA|nr:ATPase, V1 complex, subunit D [Carpediemonas membranifera]|eukprot:KAG9389632.1 ATPase, V1 complex, subunit D [Carpediemonas membranifera]